MKYTQGNLKKILFSFSIFLTLSCQKLDLNNPSEAGTSANYLSEAIKCLIGETAICKPASLSTTTPTVVAGNTLNTLTWGAVTSATSYTIYFGTRPGVTKASGTAIPNVVSPYIHSSIANNTLVYYVVVVIGASSESALSTEVSATPICSPCKMFVTDTTYTGNLGGISGADTKCSTDANKPSSPSSAVFKALITDGTGTRVACTTANCGTGGLSEHVGWVLQPSKIYVKASTLATVVTTNANGIWTSAILSDPGSGTAVFHGFAMSDDWISGGNHCTNWTGTAGLGFNSNSSATLFVGTVNTSCTNSQRLICVEQ